MIKKIYGLTDKGEQVELAFTKFLMITDNDSHLTIDTICQNDSENSDLLLWIDCGPVVQDEARPGCMIATEGLRYFNVLPGGSNLVHIKVVRKSPVK